MSDTSKTPENPFEAFVKMGAEFSAKMAEAAGPGSQAVTPEGFDELWPTMPKEMMEMFFGKGLNPDALDVKTRLLLTLQGLTLQAALSQSELSDAQLRLTLRHLIEAGVTDQEVGETLAIASLFGGAGAAAKVMELFQAERDSE